MNVPLVLPMGSKASCHIPRWLGSQYPIIFAEVLNAEGGEFLPFYDHAYA